MKLLSGTLLALGCVESKRAMEDQWKKMDKYERILMKKGIAENMMSSTHLNGGFSGGPKSVGTIRHVPNSLKKQQICMDIPTIAEVKSAEDKNSKEEQIKRHITLKTMQAVMDGSYQEWIEHLTQDTYPEPTSRLEVNYRHEDFKYLDLGQEFDLDDKSFTLAALVKLRPNENLNGNFTNRGARILSKRADSGQGWELVAPSFYTGSVSLYAGNEDRKPGHIDYGRSRLPDNTWMCVGTSVDRENFGNHMAHVVPFVNGFSDGPGTSMKMTGSLSNKVPITLGNHRDESGVPVDGRRDKLLEGAPRIDQQFQGDINQVMYWDRALTHKEIRMMCRRQLAALGVETGHCPQGYEQFDCECYQVFDHEMMTFEDAKVHCDAAGASLAMPKTEQHQDFIEMLMQQSHAESFWIGLDDLEDEHVHRWADGSLMDYANNEFNRYPNGKPDKVYFSEDCVEEVKSRSGFYWNDENCAKANAFVCQLDDPTANCVAVHSARDKKTESIELDMEGFQGISLKSSGLKITNGSKNTNNKDAKRRGKNFNGGK